MDLITLRLEDLGVDALVYDKLGNAMLDLTKVRSAKRGYQDKWEINFCIQKTKGQTPQGYPKLSVYEQQSREDREAKLPRNYIGNGIRLFEDNNPSDLPY